MKSGVQTCRPRRRRQQQTRVGRRDVCSRAGGAGPGNPLLPEQGGRGRFSASFSTAACVGFRCPEIRVGEG